MSVIECRALGRRFGSAFAVKDVTLHVDQGESFALLGPNGAGKTTVLHMFSTLLRPSSGLARIAGFDLVHQARQVRSSIGVVFQEPALDERLTAAENLAIHAALHAMPDRLASARIEQALAWAALADTGYRTVRTFSGGMKRRLELARALMHRPRVLLLDEPTVGLDPQGRRQLRERIAALKRGGVTVVVSTHYLLEAESCDRVGILHEGRLVACGSPVRLKIDIAGTNQCSLEEVFLRLTGKQLRDEEASPRARLLSYARQDGEHSR